MIDGGRIYMMHMTPMCGAPAAGAPILIAIALAACVGPQRETAVQQTGDHPVRIGFSMDTLKEERWTRDKALVEQRAREVGALLDIQVANGDDAVQTKQCENMLAK